MAGGISLHAVDLARGVAAVGLRVELWRVAPDTVCLADGRLGANGQLDHPSARGEGIVAGRYEVRLHVGDFLRATVGPDASPFLEVVPFAFKLDDPGPHLHLPFKFTAWGCQLFKGV
jgi:5-hydroxyisourate hydrolase